MFAGNSTVVSIADFDRVLAILDLVGDPPKTKEKVEHVRKLQAEFERLAKEQSAFAKEREEHAANAAARDKELAARETDVVRREKALEASEARVAHLENDLRRRLALLKSAAA